MCSMLIFLFLCFLWGPFHTHPGTRGQNCWCRCNRVWFQLPGTMYLYQCIIDEALDSSFAQIHHFSMETQIQVSLPPPFCSSLELYTFVGGSGGEPEWGTSPRLILELITVNWCCAFWVLTKSVSWSDCLALWVQRGWLSGGAQPLLLTNQKGKFDQSLGSPFGPMSVIPEVPGTASVLAAALARVPNWPTHEFSGGCLIHGIFFLFFFNMMSLPVFLVMHLVLVQDHTSGSLFWLTACLISLQLIPVKYFPVKTFMLSTIPWHEGGSKWGLISSHI